MKNIDYHFFCFRHENEFCTMTPLWSLVLSVSQKQVLVLKQRRQADAETTAANLAWTQDLM